MDRQKDVSRSMVAEAALAARLDPDALAAQVDQILGEAIDWIPVRHHSPALGRMVAERLRQRRPRIVFIECPWEAQGMIQYLLDPQTRPPVAIYSCYRQDAAAAAHAGGPDTPGVRSSAWYPLVSYSPELIAMQAARDLGAEVQFIDLPHFARIPRALADPLNPEPVSPHPEHEPGPGLQEFALSSAFYQALARIAGHRSWEETWDALFETPRPARTAESLRREVALFCAGVRATADPAAIAADGTLARERFMWQTIRQTLADRGLDPAVAAVVCGGFHIFLDQNDPEPPPAVPPVPPMVTIAPYSYFRISRLAGYGAGNRAPRFYEMCAHSFAATGSHDQVVIEFLIDVIKEARRKGESLSVADAISAAQHALLLAQLRGRREPLLDDLTDALVSCCARGNPLTDATHLLAAIDEVKIGTRLGRVTERIGRLPIISDFYDQLERLELAAVVERENVCDYVLDRRKPLDFARSAFLHRVQFLGLEIGTVSREAAAFGQSIFREHWRILWTPRLEAGLIEKNLLGDTIENAATTLLTESLGSRGAQASATCRTLLNAVEMDLPRLVVQAEPMAAQAIDHDDRLFSLADALAALLILERYAAYRGLDRGNLAELIGRAFDRACLAILDIVAAPEEEWEQVVQALLALAEPAIEREDMNTTLFATQVAAAARVSTVPYLRGLFLGVLCELRRLEVDALASALLGYVRGPREEQIHAGDFLQGVLRVSRIAILLGAQAIVAAVDELLRLADEESFLVILAKLRAAFELLHDRQRDRIAALVAELHGLKEGESLRRLATSVGAAALMAELDASAAAILDQWLGDAP